MASIARISLRNLFRKSRFVHITAVFVALFLACSLVVWLTDDSVATFGDGLWFSFEVISTIGFGDVLAYRPVARVITVVLSIYSVFYLAMITGVVVSYLTEAMRAESEEKLMNFLDDLERLEELDHDELVEISAKVRKFRHARS